MQNKLTLNSTIGLDIGAYAIKMAQFSCGEKSTTALKCAAEKIPPGLSEKGKGAFIAEAVKKMLSANKFRKADFSLSIPQSESCIRMITIPRIAESEIAEAVKWAAKKYIAWPQEQTLLCYSLAGEVIEAEARKIKVIFLAALKDVFQKYTACIRNAGPRVSNVNTSCFALGNLLSYAGAITDKAVVLLDVGYSGANITFFKDKQLVFTRNVSEGESAFNEIIKERLSAQAGQGQAEDFKKKFGIISEEAKGPVEGAGLAEYAAASGQYLERLLKELRLSFNHYSQISHGEEVEKIILCGGGAGCKNLDSALAQKLSLPVERIAPPAGIFVSEAQDFSFFAVALGAALESGKNPNLILSGAKERKKGFFSGQKTLKRIVAGFAALFILASLALFINRLYYLVQIRHIRERLNELENKNAELLSLKHNIARLELRKKIFEAVSQAEPPLAEILIGVSKVVDSREIFIDTLNFEATPQKGAQLIIRGQIIGNGQENLSDTLHTFILGLEGTKFFKKVAPEIHESAGFKSPKKTLTFSLECQLNKAL